MKVVTPKKWILEISSWNKASYFGDSRTNQTEHSLIPIYTYMRNYALP